VRADGREENARDLGVDHGPPRREGVRRGTRRGGHNEPAKEKENESSV
jgi:hypothetical protein